MFEFSTLEVTAWIKFALLSRRSNCNLHPTWNASCADLCAFLNACLYVYLCGGGVGEGWDGVSFFHCETLLRCFAPDKIPQLIIASVLDITTQRVQNTQQGFGRQLFPRWWTHRLLCTFHVGNYIHCRLKLRTVFHDAEHLCTSPSSLLFLYELWIMKNRSITVFSGLARSVCARACVCVRA
jgi:hypothetical protein